MRSALAALLAVVGLVGGAGATAAHTELVSTAPMEDALVSIATQRLVMVFAGDVSEGEVEVRDPRGSDVTRGRSGSLGTVVDVALDLQAPGRHAVSYRVVGSDGHVISGTWSFTVVSAAGGDAADDRQARLELPREPGDVGGSQGQERSSDLWFILVLVAGGVALVVRTAVRAR